jgi:hypothetical protein
VVEGVAVLVAVIEMLGVADGVGGTQMAWTNRSLSCEDEQSEYDSQFRQVAELPAQGSHHQALS